jgi:outer membrane receptor for ferrienterochelin and colicins
MATRSFILCLLIVTGYTVCVAQDNFISGIVKDSQTREPLPFASVLLLPLQKGITTDHEGKFTIQVSVQDYSEGKLVISFIGYKTDTLKIYSKQSRYTISLEPDFTSLKEVVVVSGTMKEVTKMNSPIPVEIYSPAFFLKNPTPSIFESLGMINGVQPQLNCNVCNTGDIHINGMEGPYTMILIDGMPIVSSLATVYGLAGIPNSMIQRIEVVKGPASTLYGSEAVGGLINIITKDPATSARLQTDISATSLQEYNADISTKFKLKNAQSLVGINYFNFKNILDVNEDNFTDLTQQDRISIFNKWDFTRKENRTAAFALRYVYEDRWGGELNWTKRHRGSNELYGESIYTNRAEIIGNYQLPVKEKLFLDYSYNYHQQNSYYGTIPYFADQQVNFVQLRWDKKVGRHDLLFGLPFRYVFYDDNTPGTSSGDSTNIKNLPMHTYLPGVFIQDEVTMTDQLTLLTGIRYDHHNKHGNILSPRLSIKFSPNKEHTFRISTGNGFRVVNLFTEDHAALTGARKVIIKNELKPEESWNANINYATQIKHASGFVGIDASAFYTYFTNKIVGDFRTDPDLIIYDNLDGHAISKGITINTDIAFTNSLKIITGVTLMDVYQVETNELNKEVKTPQQFAPKVSGTYSISYYVDKIGLTLDLTGRVNGPMYLPVVPNDFRPEKSPWFTTANVQLTKTFTNGIELYGGAKNLLNFIPKDPLLRPFDPFDKNITINNPYGYSFDTSYNYAPIQGIKLFAGLRYTIQ